MTLRQRILLLLSAVVLVLVALSGGAWTALARRDREIALIDQQLEPARTALQEAQSALLDQEAASRSYIITGDPSYLMTHRVAGDELDASFAELRARLWDVPELSPLLDRAAEAARRWQDRVGEPEIALAREGNVEQAIAIAEAPASRRLFNTFRVRGDELRQAIVEEQADARRRSRVARGWLAASIAASLLVAVSLVALTGALLRRWITAPLREISGGADIVVAGDLHRPIPAAGPPEIAHLARTVERMRAGIVGSLAEATAAREALQQEGPAVVMLREELRPEGGPLPQGVTVGAAFQPARGILAGDWYDWVVEDDGRVAVAVVDVAGHGEAAGAYALRSKHLLLAALRDGHPPDRAVAWLARHLTGDPEAFLTAAVVVIDPAAGRCHYVNAGHPSPLLATGDSVHTLAPTGPLVGPLPGTWLSAEVPFPAGGTLVMYTDGLIEARNHQGQFGEQRLVDVILDHATQGPHPLVTACLNEVVSFVGGPPEDDATIVAVRAEVAG